MHRFLTALPVLLVAAPVFAQGGSPIHYDLIELQDVLHAAMDQVSPSTVTVQTFGGTRKVAGGKRPLGFPQMPNGKKPPKGKKKPKLGMSGFLQSQGATTGIVLSKDGWILVSKFALNYDPTSILITLGDGRTFTAERKGEDISRQIALVKIDAKDLPVPKFGDPRKVAVGQWAFVLGRTFGGRKDPSVHMGVVSATRRVFGRAIQTDAYTSPANYGGPLIDIEGKVLGMAVPMDASGRKANVGLYDSGIGFAATINDIWPLIERMKTGEVLHRGFMGVAFDLTHLGPGARLKAVNRKSAAYKAGIRKGQIVTHIDGVEVMNSFHMQMLVGIKMAGDRVHLKVQKKSGEFGVTVFLTKVPEAKMAAKKAVDPGVNPWDEDKKDK